MMCFTARRGAVLLAAALAASAPAHADYAAEMQRLRTAAPKDATLYGMQAGLAALAEGRLPEARQRFDATLEVLEGMFANTAAAARARSLWYAEGAKEFKGEPYERAMAFYYRGLLYLIDADYENARAVFRSALMQDAFAEEDQYRSDFASLLLLEGWANQLAGDKVAAADAYAEAQRVRPALRPPGAGDNVMIIAELGGSPRKVGDGIGNEAIVYRQPKRTPERRASVQIDGVTHALIPAEDVFFQASTRGGRAVDAIIAGKVSFQNTSAKIGDAFGNIASKGSLISAAAGGRGSSALGAFAAIGAISSVISANVQPRADTRYWNNLPETMHMLTLRRTGLPQQVGATLFDTGGNPVPVDTLVVHRWIDKNGNILIWLKSRN